MLSECEMYNVFPLRNYYTHCFSFTRFPNCRIQKDDATIDIVKVDDPKKPEIKPALTQRPNAEAKPEKNGYHVQNILPPNNAKLQFSPQLKIPSSGLKSTKLLGKFGFY